MYLDYSKITFDKNGNPETPDLILKTLGNKMVGIIPGVFNLKINVKFSEPSEISFDIPAKIDGKENPLYESVTGYKQIYTKDYGVYVTLNPSTEADGISEVKHVKGYSYEKTLESKKFFLEEGTFNFWNPASPADTILGRVLEGAIGWSAGYVSPALIGKYRTFDGYDDYLLSFMYNTAPEKFRCVFVFDTYKKTINVYDADEERPSLPIYLDFDNLIESLDIEEQSDELVTAIRPYGADDLNIIDVNPTGTNWIYDLSYFIANGDIRPPLSEKWEAWQRSVINRQLYYKGLVGLQASSSARLLAEQATLADLKGELENLIAQQSVTIQALSLEKTEAGKVSQQAVLNEINAKISAKRSQVKAQESVINEIDQKLDADNPNSYTSQRAKIVKELSIKNYFSADEFSEISQYFIEQDITEDTFVATSVSTSIAGNSYTVSNSSVSISGAAITEIDLRSEFNKRMYVVSGGTFALDGNYKISGDIIRGTLETSTNGDYILSFYAGTIQANDKKVSSGMISIHGKMSGLQSDIASVTIDEITTREGTRLRFTSTSGALFLTANVSDYQKYSVEMELFDYAVKTLSDLATPTYEFSVNSANFLFAKEFEPFRKRLALGYGIYLNIGGSRTITPYIIEFELDFEDHSKFSIVFSNRFKRHDNVNTLKDMLDQSYSTSRRFDASKYIYNQTAGQATMVSEFMKNSLEAAKNTILAAANQSVIIDGAGIHVGSDSNFQLRIVDSMIAMTDDGWQTAKMAIGRFASPEIGEYWGVNAEVIGGHLIVGHNLIIENANDRGVMQFKVDATGAWLYNASFVLQSDEQAGRRARANTDGGLMILDPDFGLVAGTKLLFDTNGTTVTPEFLDENGAITFDNENMPENANFFLDIRDGSAYFRGMLRATSGQIGGFTIESDYLHTGSGRNFVAINGSGTNANSIYAIWAGAGSPASAPFWVKKNGDVSMKNADIKGTINASKFLINGNDALDGGKIKESFLHLEGITSVVEDKERGLRSEISQTAERITSRVDDFKNDLSSEITQTASSIKSRVDGVESSLSSEIKQTASSIESKVTGLDNKYTSISQKVESIDIEGTVNSIVDSGFGAINFVDEDDRGRTVEVGSIKSIANGSSSRKFDMAIAADRTLILNAGNSVLFQTDTGFDCEVDFDGGDEGTRIWVSASRYWTFSRSGIYYCDADGNHLNSVKLLS